jgi:hypothetical protein
LLEERHRRIRASHARRQRADAVAPGALRGEIEPRFAFGMSPGKLAPGQQEIAMVSREIRLEHA